MMLWVFFYWSAKYGIVDSYTKDELVRLNLSLFKLAFLCCRTILALGYYITMDKPPARIKQIRLPNEPFMQPNGYKPAPLDLSAITLTPKMEELVDLLAENTHNLWAKERIQQGWTYGLNEVGNV